MSAGIRIGIDVGGTFTDLFLLDEATGKTARHKLPSTPDEPHRAPIQGLLEILGKAGAAPAQVRFVGLGTTVATNALIERKVARTGLITTEGFRDLLEIGRQKRPHVYDMFAQKPPPLVPRHLRLEVAERMASDGAVIRRLKRADVTAAIERLIEEGVDSVAICFLNAYVNPVHEAQAAQVVRRRWKGGFVTVSHELLPEFREYERLTSTVVNAALMPRMQRYLSEFGKEVGAKGFPNEPFVMNSGGGVASCDMAGARPIDTLSSGPSGGVAGAAYLASLAACPNIVAFDMGGTSTDVCLIRDGRPEVTPSRLIDGLPIKSAAVDVHSVGAGGSSIAWIDAGGLLRVGPMSAGAKPGPACYGLGGTEPTVTDANVVLGRLNPRHLLGGALKIEAERSAQAIESVVAKPKGLSLHPAAAAILAVSNTSIAQAIRFVSVERGLDPRQFVLVAFGGAGPLHAAAVARVLDMEVLVPEGPGVLCAMGVLAKDVQADVSQTRLLRETAPDFDDAIRATYAVLERRARETLGAFGVDGVALERSVDARYVGQNFELPVLVPTDPAAGQRAAIRAGFDEAHKRLYGYAQPEKELELVTFRLKAFRPVPKPQLQRSASGGRTGGLAPVARRRAFFESAGGFVDCPVFERAQLGSGDTLRGPAIIEQMDTTTVVPPDFTGAVDAFGNLRLRRDRGDRP